MRVVAGEFRGRRLTAPVVARRPGRRRTAFARRSSTPSTSLDVVDGALVADLYAGSGALGIEALSRGAEHCTFVESDRHALSAIHDNIATLGLTGRTRVMSGDVLVMVPRIDCDVAFADPPYDFTDWPRLLDRVRRRVARRRGGDRGGRRRGRWEQQRRQALRPHLGHVSSSESGVVVGGGARVGDDPRRRTNDEPTPASTDVTGRARARAAQPASPPTASTRGNLRAAPPSVSAAAFVIE